MADAFDIEEIFPGDAEEDAADAGGPGGAAVRLPRRQAGPAPQGLAVTLLADYTLRTRAWLPSGAIVALLAEAGASEAGARTAISRLARRGVLEGRREGRHSLYRLAGPAAEQLAAGGRWIVAAAAGAEPWDGWWTLIAFSLPQQERARRRALRGRLRWLGCAPLYDGLWISPHELPEPVAGELSAAVPGAMTVFRARHLDVGAAHRRDPLRAWDVDGIAGQYEAFIAGWRPLLPRIAAGDVTGAEAVRARTAVMDTYRRFAVLDPRLPLRLLPARWPRLPARDVFAAVYDGLAGAAEAHVRAVIERHTARPAPGIGAHSVAELLAGVGDGAAGPGGDPAAPAVTA